MQRISPVLFFASVALAFALTACGSSADDEALTSIVETDADATTTTPASDDSTDDASTDDEATVTTEAAITTIATVTTTEPVADDPVDDVGVLCNAYLESISFGTVDQGIEALIAILGPDAPSGVQGALETLQNPDGDIEGFFAAQNSVDGYVLPICRDRFSASIVPAADDATASEAFVAAVRDGNVAAAEKLAPTNIIASFDWNGFPDATSEFSADNSTVTMLLEPTVTVFCQMAGGAVEACAFGE